MSEHNETLAEIVAEMRKRMKSYYYSREGRNLMRQYADRIEAAWKRERAEIEANALAVGGVVEAARNKPSGNSAAMREALEMAKVAIEAAKKKMGVDNPMILEILDAALAAPARNCDRFGGDIAKLYEACLRERGLDPEEDVPDVFADWLLALANEKGESDGSK